MFWRWELRLGRRGILLGSRLSGKQMFADQLPGRCWGDRLERGHSQQGDGRWPDGHLVPRPGCFLSMAQAAVLVVVTLMTQDRVGVLPEDILSLKKECVKGL